MISAEIRAFRNSLGLSAEAFARALGVSDGSRIREWESGRKKPHATVIVLIEICQQSKECRAVLLERANKLPYDISP